GPQQWRCLFQLPGCFHLDAVRDRRSPDPAQIGGLILKQQRPAFRQPSHPAKGPDGELPPSVLGPSDRGGEQFNSLGYPRRPPQSQLLTLRPNRCPAISDDQRVVG